MPHSTPHFSPQNLTAPSDEVSEVLQVALAEKTQPTPRPSRPNNSSNGNGAEKPATNSATKPEKLFKLSPRTQSLMGVQIVGTGAYLPERIVSNEELERKHGFERGWIEPRTGILNRRYAGIGEATSHMCSQAARRAIQAAEVNKNDIDLVVVGTFTPDYHCPSTACLVQEELKLDAPAMDVQAACSGFVYALVTAAQFVATGNSKMALVIGGDTNTRIVDQRDQRTGPLFGDGAGAVILTKGSQRQGLLCYQMGADGSGGPLLQIPSGGTAAPSQIEDVNNGGLYLQMDGRTVFKWAVQALTQTIGLLLEKTSMTPSDVACYLIHQANIRIIDKAMQDLGIPADRVYNNLHKYGNTSGGSIPIALDEALKAGRFQRDDTLLFSGFGAGLTWGTALFRW
jgi:3-oxoacyl-[acyl-carrier-protein] synthase III